MKSSIIKTKALLSVKKSDYKPIESDKPRFLITRHISSRVEERMPRKHADTLYTMYNQK